MKYCPSCKINVDDFYQKCWQCEGELETVSKKSEVNQQQTSNFISAFLATLGLATLGLGTVGSFYIGNSGHEFDIMMFIASFLCVCVSGSVILALSEVISKLHKIEINTRKEVKQRIEDIEPKPVIQKAQNPYIKK